LLEQAAEALAALEPQLSVEFLREMLLRKSQLLERERNGLLSDAKSLANWLGTPATEWDARDLDGKPHALKDYKQKMLVLCFWTRGCAWAMRTLQAINDLAAESAAAPVVFLGINADGNRDDAARVAHTLNLVFPTIIDEPGERAIARSCGVDSYPTTVVVDPCGNIRRIRAGHSFHLSSLLTGELPNLVTGEPCASRG
jgi:peroxiredoxin